MPTPSPRPLERRSKSALAAAERAFNEFVSTESSWRPSDRGIVAHEGWLRANGYAPDRRASASAR